MAGTAHIGRVGTLAVALGIGLAVAGPVGVAWADPEASDSGGTTAGQSPGSSDGADAESAGSRDPGTGSAESAGGVEPVDSDNDVSRPTDTDEAAAESGDDGPDGSRTRARKTRSWPRARVTSTVPTRRLRQLTEKSDEPSDAALAEPETPGPAVISWTAINALPNAEMIPPKSAPATAVVKATLPQPTWRRLASTRLAVQAPAPVPAGDPGKPSAALTMLALASTPRHGSDVTVAAALPTYTTSSVPVGAEPAGVALSVDGTRAYVANSAGKSVSVVNTATGAVLATVPVGGSASAVALNPTGSRAYVTLKSAAKVAVIDTVTNKVVASVAVGLSPTSVIVSPNGSRVYVTNTGGGTVSVIDTATNTRIANVSVGLSPTGITMSRDGARLYMALKGSDQVAVFNPVNNSVITRVKVGSSPRDVAMAPNGAGLYVANGAGSVSVIDTVTNRAIGSTILVGPAPTSLAFSSDGSQVFVANQNDTVSVIDTATSAVVQTVSIDAVPESGDHDIAVSANGTRLYVTDQRDGALRVLSVAAPDTTAPVVSLGSLAGTVSGTVTLNATASDNVGVAAVQFLVDNQTLSTEDTMAPYTVSWDTATIPNGSHTVAVRARDAAGNTTTSPSVRVTVANVVNHPPMASPTVGAPTQASGAVSISLNATDADSNPLSYVVTASPGGGALQVGVAPGTYTYTPYFLTRFNANRTPTADTDAFTVRVSDGTSSIDVPITVPIGAAGYRLGASIPVGAGPTHVAVSSTRAYIANTTDDTVTVIDTGTNTVIATVGVGDEPGAIAIRGDRVYVANYAGGSVSVISSSTNTVVATIAVGARPVGLAPTADGTKIYVSNGYDVGTVTVVDANRNTVLKTIPVGTALTDIVVTPDSRSVFVAHAGGSGDVAVIATATDTVVTDISLGFRPTLMTMAPSGTAVFVSGGMSDSYEPTTYVISTATNSVADVRFDVGYQGFAPDGTLAYSSSYFYSDFTFNAFYINDGIVPRDYIVLPTQGYSGLPFTMSPDGTHIYIADTYANQVYPIVFMATTAL